MEKNKKPQIRFKGFTNDWEQRKLGEIGSVSMCRRIFKEQTSKNGDIPFYKIGTFGGEADAYISKELFEEYKQKYPYPQKGDILISASGSIGRIVEFTGENEYFQDSNIVWLNHDERINNTFLKCFYNVVKWFGLEGSTIKRLYNDNILKTEILLPMTDEQYKISCFFENLDNLITLHQRKCEKLKIMKKSCLEKMFPKNNQKIPDIRFKRFTNDWEQRKLKEICAYTSSSLTASNANIEGKYELFDANEMIGKTDDFHMPENYITIIKDGAGVGRIRKLSKNTAFIGTMGALTSSLNQLEYLYYLLEKKDLNKQFTGSTIPHIYFKDYGEDYISVPTIEEQEKIGAYFEQLDNLITLHQRKVEKLKKIKKSCLEKMFV